jgi:hypothetical protein
MRDASQILPLLPGAFLNQLPWELEPSDPVAPVSYGQTGVRDEAGLEYFQDEVR